MTPKQKAKQLVERFYTAKDSHGTIICEFNSCAKQCALITVDEILSVIPMYTGNLNPKWKYWQEVKQEIQKL